MTCIFWLVFKMNTWNDHAWALLVHSSAQDSFQHVHHDYFGCGFGLLNCDSMHITMLWHAHRTITITLIQSVCSYLHCCSLPTKVHQRVVLILMGFHPFWLSLLPFYWASYVPESFGSPKPLQSHWALQDKMLHVLTQRIWSLHVHSLLERHRSLCSRGHQDHLIPQSCTGASTSSFHSRSPLQ